MSGCVVRDDVRRLRYRLRRLGMLELEHWLAPLLRISDEDALWVEIARLLEMEIPELEAMMRGRREIPVVLRPWLR